MKVQSTKRQRQNIIGAVLWSQLFPLSFVLQFHQSLWCPRSPSMLLQREEKRWHSLAGPQALQILPSLGFGKWRVHVFSVVFLGSQSNIWKCNYMERNIVEAHLKYILSNTKESSLKIDMQVTFYRLRGFYFGIYVYINISRCNKN